MATKSISIESASRKIAECETVLVVPEKAGNEAGYIQMLSMKESGHAKHEYHALAQMAYFQQQENEIEIREIDCPCTLQSAQERIELGGGIVICRGTTGEIYVLVQPGQNIKKLLEAAYRYCTRWVRLDI